MTLDVEDEGVLAKIIVNYFFNFNEEKDEN